MRPATSPADIGTLPVRSAPLGRADLTGPDRSFAAQYLAQPGQPDPELALHPAVGGLVVLATDDVVRRVLLGEHAQVVVVGIAIAVAVSQALGARVSRPPQRRRHGTAPALAKVGDRGVDP